MATEKHSKSTKAAPAAGGKGKGLSAADAERVYDCVCTASQLAFHVHKMIETGTREEETDVKVVLLKECLNQLSKTLEPLENAWYGTEVPAAGKAVAA